MNYQNTLTYLYNDVPMFQYVGGAAYREGLKSTQMLDKHFEHFHRSLHTIHVTGTNGEGSCSHTLAAILQEVRHRVGLYTSPHLVDFREHIRINGQPIPEKYVADFVEEKRDFFKSLHPSFFELTTATASRYFADEKVDVAVIEAGLGDRLDCTNIIYPGLCIITNISFDHVQFLGDTLTKIAGKKAGIIKAGVPAIIGETTPETKPVLLQKATEKKAPVISTEDTMKSDYPKMKTELQRLYQIKNTRTILAALSLLKGAGYWMDEQSTHSGLAHVCELTRLTGRWQKLQGASTLICDAGHSVGGITCVIEQLKQRTYRRLHITTSMMNDKDTNGVLSLLPKGTTHYFTKASVKHAPPAEELCKLAAQNGLQGSCYPDIFATMTTAQEKSHPEDFIFVGGSSFTVADLLANRNIFNLH